jgi:hypothetical protein
MSHRHDIKCLEPHPGGGLACKVTGARHSGDRGHRHTKKCENPWGAMLCKQNVAPMLKGIAPVKTSEGTYSLGDSQYAPFYGRSGPALFERTTILRNGEHAGSMAYQPHSYPTTPWTTSMSRLVMALIPGEVDPFRNPGAAAFDFNSNSPRAALAEFARRAEARFRWFQGKKGKRA